MKSDEEILHQYINRLELWHNKVAPPSEEELRKLDEEIPLTIKGKKKLESLAYNHIVRAHQALKTRQYALALAEINRAVLLKPRDPAIRLELADVYLQRSLDRGHNQKDRRLALLIAEAALEIQPRYPEAVRFIQDYQKIFSIIKKVRKKPRWLIFFLFIVLIVLLGFLFRNTWREFFFPVVGRTLPTEETIPLPPILPIREVPTKQDSLAGTGLEVNGISAAVGRRMDGSWVAIQGRLTLRKQTMQEIVLEVRGRDNEGSLVFSFPWTVQEIGDPLLRTGDTQALNLFRWLAISERNITQLEILPRNLVQGDGSPPPLYPEGRIVWETPRPEGVSLAIEVREFHITEAYDRQVLRLELGLENTGIKALESLETIISLSSDTLQSPWIPLDGQGASLAPQEIRRYKVLLSIGLDKIFNKEDLSILMTRVTPALEATH